MSAPMVEWRGVAKSFGAAAAVRGVDLAVEAGEFLTLLGPSGCGKTTLLRMVSGLETPDAGSVRLDGEDVTAVPPWRRDVHQVFQGYALFPHLDVRGNVAFGLRMRKRPRDEIAARVAEALRLVGLEGLGARRPAQLSGGQRQRVALARALVCRPKVLLLDEPLSALDARLRRSMRDELKALQRQVGITFVFVTHDQEEALALSDRIAVIRDGRLEQLGPPSEVYHRPRSRFVASFLGDANLLPAALVAPDRVRLLPEGPELAFVPAALPTSGGEVLLCVRPERVRVAPAPSAGSVPAEVLDAVFQGATVRLTLASGLLRLTALVAAPSLADAGFHPGATVHWSLDPAALVLLPAETSAQARD